MKYKRKSEIINAVKYDGNYKCLDDFPFSEVMDFIVSTDGIIIPGKESDINVYVGDYIVRDSNGTYYVYEAKEFEHNYELCNNVFSMEFGDAVKALKKGLSVSRYSWDGSFVVKQVPVEIKEDIIPKMQSLPDSAKDILLRRKEKTIKYTNQLLIVDSNSKADSWIPSSEDIFAEDWFIIK